MQTVGNKRVRAQKSGGGACLKNVIHEVCRLRFVHRRKQRVDGLNCRPRGGRLAPAVAYEMMLQMSARLVFHLCALAQAKTYKRWTNVGAERLEMRPIRMMTAFFDEINYVYKCRITLASVV